MKKTLQILQAAFILVIVAASAQAVIQDIRYVRPCADVDLCDWDQMLPLGSENCCGCGLSYNTYWPLNTEAQVTCTFDGSDYQAHDLYVSIDNDIIVCTLNDEVVFDNTVHEGCAPEDPRDGYQASLDAVPGENVLYCEVLDRGSMSHFDACVIGSEPNVPAPEFASMAIPAIILLLTPGLAYYVAKKE